MEYKKYREEKSKSDRYIVYSKGKGGIKHRFSSYIIHYTGKGHREKGSNIEQIKKDLSIMNNKTLSHIISWFPFIERFF